LPDGLVTILFTDLEGSTALRTRLGDAEADALFARHDDLLKKAIAAHDGHDQGAALGDGFVAVFSSTKRAVACAVDIQDALDAFNRSSASPRLRVRIGLHAGEVAWRDGQLSGEAVHAAARVCAAAAAGQILVSDVTRQLAGTVPDATFRDAGEFELKGFPTPWRLWEVAGASSGEAAPSSVFVGRDAELATLRTHLHAALDGRGSLVLIGGEPGVGKTTLVRQLIAEAERSGALAVFGRCYEAEGSIPYAPFVEMLEQALALMPPELVREDMGDDAPEVARMVPELRRRFPDIAEPLELPPEQQRRYFMNGVTSFIARGSQRFPLVLVIDDIHWADQPTLLLTEHMASALRDLPVLAVGTYRDVELDVSRPLAATVDHLLRERLLERVPVRRFDRGGVATMIEALAGAAPPDPVVDVIYSETEGNPFFVEEVYRHLVEDGRLFDEGRFRDDIEVDELDVPESVRLVVGRRLERLGTETQKVLAAGAVVGRAFPFELLGRIVDTEPGALLDAVEEAEAAHIIVAEERDRGVHYTFGHELIRQTLLSGLSVVRRQRLHLAVADAIEAMDERARDERPSEIAGHLLHAGAAADRGRTFELLKLAADRAFEAAAFEEALRHIDYAIDTADPEDRPSLARLRARRGWVMRALGQSEQSVAIWSDVVDELAEAGLLEEAGELCFESGYQYVWLNRFDDAFMACYRGLGLVGADETAIRAELLAYLGGLLGLAGQYEVANEQLVPAEAMARRLGSERTLGRVLWNRTMNEWTNLHAEEAIAAGREAIDRLRRANDQWTLVDALNWTSYPLILSGTSPSLAEGAAMARESIELARRLGHHGGEALALRSVVMTGDLWSGDVARFEDDAARELDAFVESPWVSQSHVFLSIAALLRGDLEVALHHAELAVELEPGSGWSGVAGGCRLLVSAWAGDVERCRTLLDELEPSFPGDGPPSSIGPLIATAWAVEACVVAGFTADAAVRFPVLAKVRGASPILGFDLSLLDRTTAMAAAAAEQWDEAERLFEAALIGVVEPSNVIERTRIQLWYGDMLLGRGGPGDAKRAQDLLEACVETADELGLPLMFGRARDRLAEA
jgi:class 3 adenylate cyclase/tetratricopeptide (TPR) repeat protein